MDNNADGEPARNTRNNRRIRNFLLTEDGLLDENAYKPPTKEKKINKRYTFDSPIIGWKIFQYCKKRRFKNHSKVYDLRSFTERGFEKHG